MALENWKRRTEIVDYCVNVVDQSTNEKRRALQGLQGDARAQRKMQAELFAEEVKVRNPKRVSLPSLTASTVWNQEKPDSQRISG